MPQAESGTPILAVACWGMLRVETSGGGSINRAGLGHTGERLVDCSLTSWHGHSSYREQDHAVGHIYDEQRKKIPRRRPGEYEAAVRSSLT